MRGSNDPSTTCGEGEFSQLQQDEKRHSTWLLMRTLLERELAQLRAFERARPDLESGQAQAPA